MPNWFAKIINYLDEKIEEMEVGVGESLHQEWHVALEVENSNEDQVCEKSYNV
jgi:hypothetical protein